MRQSILAFSLLATMAATTYATAAPLTITSDARCLYFCSKTRATERSTATFSITLDADNYKRGAPFLASDLLDFEFVAGSWRFTKSMAAALRVEETPQTVWRGPKQMPGSLYIIATDAIGTPASWLNFYTASVGLSDYWGATVGIGTCPDAECSQPLSGGNNAVVESLAPVPVPPALALMAAPVLAFAAVRRRRRVLHRPS